MDQHKILVVDDEPDLQVLMLQKFRKEIKENHYDFTFAENGQEALNILQETDDISLVLSDINMPKMDGLTFLSEAQKLEKPTFKTIMVSAYGDMDNIRTAMNRGAFDFVTKPIDFQDLTATIEKSLKEIQLIYEGLESKKTLEAVQSDLETAARIQNKMLPQEFPPFPDRDEFGIYAEMYTAKQVGGDFYDFFMLDEKRLGFVVGDVSGKGVPASLYMAVSRTMLKAIASQLDDPSECLSEVNRMLIPESDLTTFVTVFYGVLDTHAGTITYSNGGHNLPYILHNDGSVEEVENTDGILMGKFDSIEFDTKTIQLKPFDKLLVYTDGVTEAMNEDKAMYGKSRLEDFLIGRSEYEEEKIVRSVLAEVLKFIGKADQSDDITLMSLGYHKEQ
jgi:sigma-B regulation protein RsbU (phosphoserine phosphatase)